MTATLFRLPSGTVVDGWRVSRELGNGGFAVVFLVEKNGKPHALKVARHREASGDDKQTHARMVREATTLLMLDHPNIIRHRGYGYAETGNMYVALEYVDGWTLAEWKERKHPTIHEILRVFVKLASALSYMHARGVLHRDLKLVNVLIRKSDGEPIIIDFGCATYTLADDLTEEGLPPGTERFRAPEQFKFLREHKNEHRARYAFKVADEIFALGAMFYELLTDPRPTEHNRRVSLNNPLMPPPPACEVNPRIPDQLSELVEKILSRDPSKRPVDTEALRRELEEHLERSGAEYMVPAHAPSEQWRSEPSGVGGPPVEPSNGLRPRKVATKTLVAGAAVATALAAAATSWFVPGDIPALPPPPHSSPPTTSPPDMSLPSPAPMVLPSATDVGQKEGSTVKMTTPEISTQGRPTRVRNKVSAADCAALSLVAALAAGCPSSQIRPESFTCPAGAERAMVNELHWRRFDRFVLTLDDRHDRNGKTWFTPGSEVVGVVPKAEGLDRRQYEVAPPGTRFYGKAYYLSDKMGRADGPALVVRYDRVKLPGQDERPICFVVESRSYGFKDGRVQASNENEGRVVDRWP
ncbi:serine/threonine protein kinase [Stigmatella aurantiaca]|uniref:Serine/threonine protein kinase n=1 Tax=Stigmatella aurantiaca (strain DW4/3-1) TaxID=378806 RepID=Q096L8_STIAD|nr:serine/threonine-protein kinase [Stigmatella aurantiaca]ADO68685.1 Serine/threonine protein kinase [Stigmatella aurantiaca DW4/3-1]EAU67651.1 serine/threonine-protein kinase Pkn3, putative [Stigmatella aurantiaca DW4/3-1]